MESSSVGEFRIEGEILAAKLFGDVDDLAVVQAEVLDHLVDGLESADGVA